MPFKQQQKYEQDSISTSLAVVDVVVIATTVLELAVGISEDANSCTMDRRRSNTWPQGCGEPLLLAKLASY